MDVKDLQGKVEEEDLVMEGGGETTEDYSSADYNPININASSNQSQIISAMEENEEEQEEEEAKPAPPVPMPAVGHTLEFPRKDTAYKKKESLPFDECYSNVWKNRPRNEARENVAKWLAFVLAGIAIGITAFAMDQLEDLLVTRNRYLLQYILDRATEAGHTGVGMLFLLPSLTYGVICAILGLLAGLLTTYYGPGASGSGVAELIGYMNGINYPDFIAVNTMITKILGVTMAVASRLCIGMEGPLAHIGAIWGAAVCYFPANFEFLQNDEFKRQIIAAGASAGVSAAFGAPIGGTLFAYEMSKPTVFWTFEMIWRTFTCCSTAVLILALLQTLASGNVTDGFRGSTIKFGTQLASDQFQNSYLVIPAAIEIGILGGLFGALFINVNTRMNALRKRILLTKWIKPIETAIWSFCSGFIFIMVPYFLYLANKEQVCQDVERLSESNKESAYQAWCGKGHFDANASIFWASEGDIIKNIINTKVVVTPLNQFYFLLVWYLLTITTYGTNVPAGLFLPGMIIGCALGRSLFSFTVFSFDQIGIDPNPFTNQSESDQQALTRSYIILACGGFMAGYTRMTYSLAVILMETSQDIAIFTPMIITIAIANQVGYFCTRSLYERATRGKQMPMLKDSIPPPCEAVIASQIMAKEIVTLQNVETIQNVLGACKTSHHGFPILNSRGNVVGLIPKNYAVTLLDSRAFYRVDGLVDDDDDDMFNQPDRSTSVSRPTGGSAIQYKKMKTFAKKKTFKEYSNQADDEKYPATPTHLIVPWQRFCRDFWSKDLVLTREVKAVCEYYENYMIDFRPYLIESPVTVFTTDPLRNCVELMRNMYLRHIIVISPVDGSLQGIITRQDLFAWLDA